MRAMICGGLVLTTMAIGVLAGPLTPPVGPVAPTAKPLAEVEPRIAINATNTPGDADSLFRITEPGSYYLTGNITGVVGKHGIEIAASGVTIDLNGFDLVGVTGMGAFDGVHTSSLTLTDLAVLNGSVRKWGDEGVDLASAGTANCRVDGVRVSGNAGNGISVGNHSIISGCVVNNNSETGIVGLVTCKVERCVVSNNGIGMNLGVGASIVDCIASNNISTGINAGAGSVITDTVGRSNGSFGLFASSGSTLTNCTASSNGGIGIGVGPGSVVSGCSSASNTNIGINAGSGSSILSCVARLNTLDGIRAGSSSLIRDNMCDVNGNGGTGAGIFVSGFDCRIEGNSSVGADTGISVSGSGNIIIRNTCGGNTINWVIAANNLVGPILDRTSPGSASISGNSAPESIGSSHPHANFTH